MVAAAPLNMTHVVVYLQSAGVYVQNIAHERKIDKLAAAGLELMDISKQRRCKHTLCAAGIAYNGADTQRGKRGIDYAGIDLAHFLIAQAELFHKAGLI